MLRFTLAGSPLVPVVLVMLAAAYTGDAFAHCDTLDGPVVKDARVALENGNLSPVLKWVPKDKEAPVREAFDKARVVRTKGKEATELADRYFFETVVRLHRESEGAPYRGLLPSGTALEPGIAESDHALEAGNADALVKAATGKVAAGIGLRFKKVVDARRHAGDSVEAGRAFVAAYVDFVHYVERVFADGVAHSHAEPSHAEPSHAGPAHDAPAPNRPATHSH